MKDTRYGVDEKITVDKTKLLLAVLFLTGAWLYLDQKILFGEDWLSATYDHEGWMTNEGETRTYGMWDLESHIWKSEFIMEHWPHFQYNPYWYMGMPLLKYYQIGFYAVHIAVISLFGLSPAKAANMIIIFGHLFAALATFWLCLRISKKYALSAMCAFFVLANTFISLRSYGWEPITVVFLALFPIGLLVFLKQPLRPMRFWMVITLFIAYISHPLIWFSLCLFMAVYLLYTILHASKNDVDIRHNTLTQFVGLVGASLLLGAFQSIHQFSYHQVTSGAHMGVTYLPFYHVPFNVLPVGEFFFDYLNLKGPGPIVMLAFLFLIVFGVLSWLRDKQQTHPMVRALGLITVVMVALYFLELFDVFPMNIIRSVQYHRIIPEFIIVSAALIAATSRLVKTPAAKIFYYGTLISFVIAGFLVIHTVQAAWQTQDRIDTSPEFLHQEIDGRITMPYTEQSLSVRNSFTNQHQIYGYYEQGITNSYVDEMFSVSSGFHNEEDVTLYLQAAGVTRLYINEEGGVRNDLTQRRLQSTYLKTSENERYSYYAIPTSNPHLAQAVSQEQAVVVQELVPGCREMFSEVYCGSEQEEFVRTDVHEQAYLRAYVDLISQEHVADAQKTMTNPDNYIIQVTNATQDTAVIVKLTVDPSWQATVNGQEVPISMIGPDFILISPQQAGDYTIHLKYRIPTGTVVGSGISLLTFVALIIYTRRRPNKEFSLPLGDMEENV